MSARFAFDEKKSAQENIADFMSFIESHYPQFGPILARRIQNILPLSVEPNKRSADRSSFNSEIKKILDAVIAATKANT